MGSILITTKLKYREKIFEKKGNIFFDDKEGNLHAISGTSAFTYSVIRGQEQSLDLCTQESSKILLKLTSEVAHLKYMDKLVFLSHNCWQPDNRIINYKKLWGTHYAKELINKSLIKSEQVKVLTPKGIKFAGIIKVDDNLLKLAFEVVRNDQACFIMLAEPNIQFSIKTIKEMFDIAFRIDKNEYRNVISWTSLVKMIPRKGLYLIRVSGMFDDPEIIVEVIGNFNSSL